MAATHPPKAAVNTSELCWSDTTVWMGFSSPVEPALASQKSYWRTCMLVCKKIKRGTYPFVNSPEKTRGRWNQGITPAVMKRCHWVEPVLVAQIKFTEWTSDDQLRQPVFLGLRTDMPARDVVRE